jgi:hypothetical protein
MCPTHKWNRLFVRERWRRAACVASMFTRSHSKSAVFTHPFELKGVDRILPPGIYQVVTDEELIEELSFPGSIVKSNAANEGKPQSNHLEF